ncbi:hypothetical protein NQD34_008744 [Periophthalmus magnuspinnatus]|nr:hypothetical protein NQD34_008744 [Periophthalmus magnuspinnatus]
MQFGFRSNHSTEAACCYLTESIRASLDKGGTVGAVFLDLQKAFDTVNHRVLLSKLSQYHLSSDALHWVKSYLSDRVQCVRINLSGFVIILHEYFFLLGYLFFYLMTE